MKSIIADESAIDYAADLLRQGRLVAFPTETVYGLGADAGNSDAVSGIFRAKGRPADHPLIVHIAGGGQLTDWARQVPDAAMLLAEHFWPGPLAMVLNKKPEVPMAVTGGQETVGLRVPDHPVALRLLQKFGGGVAAPSANRFCRISPTLASHVEEELGDAVDLILDGGPCQVGVESTIIDLSGRRPQLLRPGKITCGQIETLLQTELIIAPGKQQTDIRAPGMMAVHYAPATPALLCRTEALAALAERLSEQRLRIGVMAYRQKIAPSRYRHLIRMPTEAGSYAQALYAAMRELDHLQLDRILVEQPPESESWRAVNDRLRKATIPADTSP